MKDLIIIGDVVMWSGCFNTQSPIEATITKIELCSSRRMKYGREIDIVSTENKDFCVFSLSNGHWAYGEQITPINQEELVEAYELYYT